MEKLTATEYYERLLATWYGAIASGRITAKVWLVEYEFCFKQCTVDNEEAVYEGFRRLFEQTSKSKIEKELYLTLAESMSRIGAFLHRFWIPNRAEQDKTVVPLIDLAKREWDRAHGTK